MNELEVNFLKRRLHKHEVDMVLEKHRHEPSFRKAISFDPLPMISEIEKKDKSNTNVQNKRKMFKHAKTINRLAFIPRQ